LDINKLVAREYPAPIKPNLTNDMLDISNFDNRVTGQEVQFTAVPIPLANFVSKRNEDFEAFNS